MTYENEYENEHELQPTVYETVGIGVKFQTK